MRIAVMGAGGLGGCLGGLLARDGHDVSLVARGPHLDAIRSRGLTVKSIPFGEFVATPFATDDPAQIGPVDLVLFCVKLFDTEEAANLMLPLIGPDTVVLSVQNGVDAEDRIASVIGYEHVIGAMAMMTGHIESPGVVEQLANIGLHIGELDGSSSERIEMLTKTFESSGVPTTARTDIRFGIWQKFAAFVSLVGVETVTRLPAGPLLANRESKALIRGIVAEVEEVAEAVGIEMSVSLTDDTMGMIESLPPNHKPSMYADLVADKRLELDGLNGALQRFGKEYAVPTPLNFAVYASLMPYADGAPKMP